MDDARTEAGEMALRGCAAAGLLAVAGIGAETGAVPASAAEPGYELSASERNLNCKKLTGRMQVRILQIRDHGALDGATGLSDAVKSVTGPMLGGGPGRTASDQQYARDVAMLRAYNQRLKDLGCKSFDLDAELRPKPAKETPQAVAKP
jgi:hypothetical protein